MSKRTGYISWDEFFMGTAELSARRSKDPNTQVGACIVGENNKVLGVGYNGFPRGCSDESFSWERPEKYLYVVHAEVNCIMNVNNFDLVKGSTLYTTLFPCNECAKIVIQAGIKHIVYLDDKYEGTPEDVAAKKMFESSGVTWTKMRKEYVNNC